MKLDKKLDQIIVDTGQHYSPNVSSDFFFKELKLPKPHYQLNAKTLPKMVLGSLNVLKKEKPHIVLVYGDTRSTLAGTLAASELGIPIVHVEAGMRSYRMDMPEERIRIAVDHLSTYLLVPNLTAVFNLEAERIKENVIVVGNVMFDTFNDVCPLRKTKRDGKYSYLTIHRQENTESKVRLESIFEALRGKEEIIFPIHHRTAKVIKGFGIELPENIKVIEPVGYKKNLQYISGARRVVTDSGGVQNEAFWMSVPCGILRRQTEWNEYVVDGWNVLLDADEIDIQKFMSNPFDRRKARPHMPVFGAKKMIRDFLFDLYV